MSRTPLHRALAGVLPLLVLLTVGGCVLLWVLA